MRAIEDIKDENGKLHMCKKCNFVLVAGKERDKVIVSKYYMHQPNGTNFVVCPDCNLEVQTV